MSVTLTSVAAVQFLRPEQMEDDDDVSILQYLISRSQFFFFRLSDKDYKLYYNNLLFRAVGRLYFNFTFIVEQWNLA